MKVELMIGVLDMITMLKKVNEQVLSKNMTFQEPSKKIVWSKSWPLKNPQDMTNERFEKKACFHIQP